MLIIIYSLIYKNTPPGEMIPGEMQLGDMQHFYDTLKKKKKNLKFSHL